LGCGVGGGETGFRAVLVSNEVEIRPAEVSLNNDVTLVAPAWTGANASSVKNAQILSDEEFRSFFGDLRTDVPWYRPRRNPGGDNR